jgi:hypothetical protein
MEKKMESIWDLKKKMRKHYYGASKAVYRKSDFDKWLRIYDDLLNLSELTTRCHLVPSNNEFLFDKAIPQYNRAVMMYRKKYPSIKEFQQKKVIVPYRESETWQYVGFIK